MAIQKSKILKSGATGNYWKITRESYDKMGLSCIYEISLFFDKAQADNNGVGLGCSKIYKHTATKEELSGDRTALGYSIIKAQANALVENIRTSKDEPIVTRKFDTDLSDGIDV